MYHPGNKAKVRSMRFGAVTTATKGATAMAAMTTIVATTVDYGGLWDSRAVLVLVLVTVSAILHVSTVLRRLQRG